MSNKRRAILNDLAFLPLPKDTMTDTDSITINPENSTILTDSIDLLQDKEFENDIGFMNY